MIIERSYTRCADIVDLSDFMTPECPLCCDPYKSFLKRIQQADYLVIGESHTSVCDHEAQVRLIKIIERSRGADWKSGKPVIALEMVPTDKQVVLNRFNKKLIGLEQLREQLDWNQTWGHPWQLYAPVFDAAQRVGLPLYAANAPRRVVKQVGDIGLDTLRLEDRHHAPDTLILPKAEQLESIKAIFSMHRQIPGRKQSGKGGPSLERFIRVQSFWDTVMAWNMIRLRQETGQPVLLIVGQGHVENGWGVPYRLKELDFGARVERIEPRRAPRDLSDYRSTTRATEFHCPPSHYSRLGYGVVQEEFGIDVTVVTEGSPAEAMGMRVDDDLLSINGHPIESIGDLHMIPMKTRGEQILRYRVYRYLENKEVELILDRATLTPAN